MYNLKIITSTVRPTRKGPLVADWITKVATQHRSFKVDTFYLGEINLPMMNERHHPMLKKYEKKHTKQWSTKIDQADAFTFVTAEYNHSYPAPLRNALQYLSKEWAYKAAGIVSYGGVSAGTRAFNDLKGDLSTLSVVPLVQAVHIPFFTQFINEEEVFTPNDSLKKSADTMLNTLEHWSKGMRVIRASN